MAWPSKELTDRLRRVVTEDMAGGEEAPFAVVASPYRICPLGAHIDHQGGAVTAMALDRGIALGFVPSSGPKVFVRSTQFLDEEVSFSINHEGNASSDGGNQNGNTKQYGASGTVVGDGGWGDYARGAAYALTSRGYHIKNGIIGIVEGCPGMHGCGISSSAALGVAFLLALEHANGLQLTSWENVELDRVIENEFLGLRNGVLDQSAILLSKKGCLTLIKCKDRSHEVVKLGARTMNFEACGGFKIMLAFSGLRHALTSKPGFNLRVSECHEAAKVLLTALGREYATKIPVLGEVSVEEYAVHRNKLQAELERRARHFFSENGRVEAGVKAWLAGDLGTFGRLVTESGRSSIENYECGCEELIQLWKIMCEAPGVLGARFSGAGFRGFCVALVRQEFVARASDYVNERYREAQPRLWTKACEAGASSIVVVCDSGDSARLICC